VGDIFHLEDVLIYLTMLMKFYLTMVLLLAVKYDSNWTLLNLLPLRQLRQKP